VDESLNGVSSPLEGSPSHPYIEFGARLHIERWVLPTRVVESPGREKRVNLAGNPSCPVLASSYIQACHSRGRHWPTSHVVE
jgi:hypothetical protein